MSDDIAARMAAQNAEFDAARELSKQMRRIELTPVVDDDYPEVRFEYERAVRSFIEACRANGRITPSSIASSGEASAPTIAGNLSEVEPDGVERRSGEVDREGSRSAAAARGDAVGAGSPECSSRATGGGPDQEGGLTQERGRNAPVTPSANGERKE